jgi:hypothetical protein
MSKMIDQTIETYGFDGLQKTFDNLSEFKDKKRIMMSAFRKALKPTVEVMLNRIPQHQITGNLKRSIGLLEARNNEIAMYAGARIRGGYKGYHGILIDHGTKRRHYITKSGAIHNTGMVRPSYFTEYAAKSTEGWAINTVRLEWEKAIARFIVNSRRKDMK